MSTEYIKLRKEDFMGKHKGRNMEATVHVKDNGLFTLNVSAVKILGVDSGGSVTLCAEKSSRNCFAIMKDDGGYCLRCGEYGQMFFNCASLARHVIDKSLERGGVPAGAVKPRSMVFIVASLPVDDGENSGVFALIRKK